MNANAVESEAQRVKLEWVDHRSDPAAWATQLGISKEAVELYLASDVVDLHIDSFLWSRMLGYDLTRRHGHGLVAAALYSEVDLPRIREAQVSGAMWVITTNPWRGEATRPEAFLKNLARLQATLESCSDDVAVVRNISEYRAARAAGKHAAFLAIQGGNALDREGALDLVPEGSILRVTVVHLTPSSFGMPSSKKGKEAVPLSERGKAFVQQLNAKRILVDLAHVNRQGFFDAVSVHDKTQPLVVTHTGVNGVHPHWRNLDDEQIRAIANTGGTIGIMYQSPFLGDPTWSGKAETIVRHLEHIISVVGEDHGSLGSDWDGMIITPRDMLTCLELPKLVQVMLDRKWSVERVQKTLGKNFLRVVEQLRG